MIDRILDWQARLGTGLGAFVAAFGVVLMLLMGVPALSQSDDGPNLLTRTLQDLLSDAGRVVTIQGFEGALTSQATIETLSIADDQGVWITLSDVVIDWNRAALFQGIVDVNEMSAGQIALDRFPGTSTDDTLPSPTAREPFSLPELPVSIEIGRIGAGRVRLGAPILGLPAVLEIDGTMRLAGGAGQAQIDARRVDGQQGVFALDAAFDSATRDLSLDLRLSEGAGGIAATLLGVPDRPAIGLSVQGAGPLETFEAEVELSTDGQPRVQGQIALIDETPDTSLTRGGGFRVDLSGDLRPLLVADLHPFFGENSVFRAIGQRTERGETLLPQLTIQTNAASVHGEAVLTAQGFPRSVSLSALIQRPDGQTVVLPGTQGQGQLERATLVVSYNADRSRDWLMQIDAEGFATADLSLARTTLAGRGRLGAASDTPDAPAFEGTFDFLSDGIAARDPALQQALGRQVYGLASLSWSGNNEGIELTGLGLEGDTVSLTAFGRLDGLTFDGFAELELPDMAAFSGLAGRPLAGNALATFQGQANPLTGAIDADLDVSGADLRVDQAEIDALLAGESRLELSLRRDTAGTSLRAATVTTRIGSVTAQGTIAPQRATVDLSVAINDLSPLGAGYGGGIFADVAINTERAVTELRVDGATIDLGLGGVPGGAMLTPLLAGATRLRVDASAQNGALALRSLSLQGDALTISGQGLWSEAQTDLTLAITRLDLSAVAPGGRGVLTADVSAQGQNGDVTYRATIQGAGPLRAGSALVDGLIGDGITGQGIVETLADGSLLIDRVQLRASGVVLDAQGSQQADGARQIALSARFPDLSRFTPLVIGALDMQADLTRPSGAAGYQVNARAQGPSQLGVTLSGRIDSLRDVALAFDGQVDGAVFSPFVEPANIAGLLRANGRVDGPLALSSLRATLSADGARYVLPAANVAFENIALRAQVAGAAAQVDIQGRSLTGGTGHISGSVPLTGGSASLDVRVADFVVRHPQLFDARINGQIAVSGNLANSPLVSGTVQVAQAEIRIPSSALGRSGARVPGLRHVGEDAQTRATRLAAGIARGQRGGRQGNALRLDLTLDAPGRVFVRGRGLDAELGGRLYLGGTTRAVVPSGQFSLIRGRLDLLGNRFTLTEGSASMLGSFVPYVSLTASTDNSGVLTSVTLAGQANAPEITFGSVPDLPDDEILARLVFGRSLTELSPFQAAQLGLSVATLTGRADNSILSRSREALGLDDLDFTVDEDGTTALRAGRYLSEDVYTDLSVDTEGRGEVSINLDLTDSVTLRGTADSDGGSSLGIFLERDY